MNPLIIEAIEHFKVYYYSDLYFIQNFHNRNNNPDYAINFRAFVAQFGLIRNRGILHHIEEIITATNSWVNQEQNFLNDCLNANPINGVIQNDVDGFAHCLQTNNVTVNLEKVLASKILFLNNPVEITPFDRNVRKAVNLHNNNKYADYLIEFNNHFDLHVNNYIFHHFHMNINLIDLLGNIEVYSMSIEANLPNMPPIISNNFPRVRENRLKDKLLWVIGKNLNQQI